MDMSDYQTDASSFDTTSAGTPTKISLRLLRNGNVSVDWSELPRSGKVRHCIIHYKSLNNNRVRARGWSRSPRHSLSAHVEPHDSRLCEGTQRLSEEDSSRTFVRSACVRRRQRRSNHRFERTRSDSDDSSRGHSTVVCDVSANRWTRRR